jgi:hypothetical protein
MGCSWGCLVCPLFLLSILLLLHDGSSLVLSGRNNYSYYYSVYCSIVVYVIIGPSLFSG